MCVHIHTHTHTHTRTHTHTHTHTHTGQMAGFISTKSTNTHAHNTQTNGHTIGPAARRPRGVLPALVRVLLRVFACVHSVHSGISETAVPMMLAAVLLGMFVTMLTAE